MNLAVVVDKNFGIGFKNKPLVSIPENVRFLQQETRGKVLVMGRRTLEGTTNGLLLKNRIKIVLSRNPGYQSKDAVVRHSVLEVLEELKQYPSGDVYVIGGASVYKEFLPYCDTAHVTCVDRIFEADAYFPDIDKLPQWVLTGESEEKTYFDLEFRFRRYERRRA